MNCSAVQRRLSGTRRPVIALVVPALAEGGGVPAVADFIARGIEHSGAYDLRCFSLATSSKDRNSTRLRDPRSWRNVQSSAGDWCGRPYTHVGAWMAEFEFMRYRPRKALRAALAGCDLIQVVGGSPACALAVCGLGVPVSLQCATLAKVERMRMMSTGTPPLRVWRHLMTGVIHRLDHKALTLVDAVQVENSWMERLVRSLRSDADHAVMFAPPGVDTDAFRPKGSRALGATGYVLCVGRLDDPRKNMTLLLESYARLTSSLASPPQLILAGASGPGIHFWSRAALLGVRERVRYIARPSRTELIALYQGAACFALSSAEEGFGMVLIEAMACGVPVVATRCGGPEGIVTDGEDGFLVPLDDAEAMADWLRRLLTDGELNHRMGLSARATVEQRFNETVTAQAFLDTYADLLFRRTSAASPNMDP